MDTRKLGPVGLIWASLATATLLSGCETMGKAEVGAGLGSIVGSFIGYNIDDGSARGAALGALVGGGAGYLIGKYMDEQDIARRNEALEHNPVGQTTAWRNQETGAEHRVTPREVAYQSPRGECRTFEQEVYVDGKRDTMTATACKQDETGGWDVVDANGSSAAGFL